MEPQRIFPTSVSAYRAVLTVLEREATKADGEGVSDKFHLFARLYHETAGMCVKEHGVELRHEFVR